MGGSGESCSKGEWKIKKGSFNWGRKESGRGETSSGRHWGKKSQTMSGKPLLSKGRSCLKAELRRCKKDEPFVSVIKNPTWRGMSRPGSMLG